MADNEVTRTKREGSQRTSPSQLAKCNASAFEAIQQCIFIICRPSIWKYNSDVSKFVLLTTVLLGGVVTFMFIKSRKDWQYHGTIWSMQPDHLVLDLHYANDCEGANPFLGGIPRRDVRWTDQPLPGGPPGELTSSKSGEVSMLTIRPASGVLSSLKKGDEVKD